MYLFILSLCVILFLVNAFCYFLLFHKPRELEFPGRDLSLHGPTTEEASREKFNVCLTILGFIQATPLCDINIPDLFTANI